MRRPHARVCGCAVGVPMSETDLPTGAFQPLFRKEQRLSLCKNFVTLYSINPVR